MFTERSVNRCGSSVQRPVFVTSVSENATYGEEYLSTTVLTRSALTIVGPMNGRIDHGNRDRPRVLRCKKMPPLRQMGNSRARDDLR